jgi:hypothetical protein
MYTRTNTRYIGYADSIDGGVTFSPVVHDKALFYCKDCMVSVTNLNTKIDGKDAIAISYPEGTHDTASRTNGVLKIGLITENEGFDAPAYGRYSVEWKYSYDINDSAFWYSCLADKGDGNIAILYEPGPLVYDEYSIEKLTNPSKKEEKEPIATLSPLKDASLCGDNEITLALNLTKEVYEKYSALEDAKATVYVKESDSEITMSFSHISDNKKTVYFKGALPVGDNEQLTLTFSLKNSTVIATSEGILSPSLVEEITVALPLHDGCEHVKGDISDTDTDTDTDTATDGVTDTETEVPDLSENDSNNNEAEDSDSEDNSAEKKRGCGSSVVSGVGISIITVLVTSVVIRKKKEDK